VGEGWRKWAVGVLWVEGTCRLGLATAAAGL